MRKRLLAGLIGATAALTLIVSAPAAFAQASVKVGLILPITGPAATIGRQIETGARLYVAQHGDKVAGKTIELIVKDDQDKPDITKQLAQQLVDTDKVAIIAGLAQTPLALAVGPVATQAKIPAVIMGAGTAMIVEKLPFFVRSGDTLPQVTVPLADWSTNVGIETVVTLVSNFGPGLDAEAAFKQEFEQQDGKVLDTLRAPVASPDFSALLQKAKDLKPDALFLFVTPEESAVLMKQVNALGLPQAGIKIIGTGDVTDDAVLNSMGDDLIGTVTSHHYSAAHDSPENKDFVAAFTKANPNMRPDFMAIGGYDGMALIYKALDKTGGDTDGQKLVDAMKGQAWTSPRGPISIDPQTRDIIQNVYIRKVEKRDGQLWNMEFETIQNVKDPTHKP